MTADHESQRPASLRLDEAQRRARLVSVDSYDVALDLTRGETTFGSRTTIRFTSAGGSTFVDLKAVSVERLRLDGSALDPALVERGRLPLDVDAGPHELVVEAVMRFRNDGEGLHRSVDPADGRHYVYGMSFMDAAPSIFACFDQPDLKAPYTFHVRTPADWTVFGNGHAEQVAPGEWELATTEPLSTYFVTLVAGPWHVLRDEHEGIPLGLSCRASIAEALDADADELFTLTRQCFDEYHRLFGIRYPFGDYHQAFVPEFNAGAMENPGCVTYRDQLVFTSRASRGARINRATTLAHEMAHQWFGNIVTPVWWDDLWLNESFAEYMGNRVTADVTHYADAWTDLAYARRQWGLVADQAPTTHPVAGNGAVDAVTALQDFDGISYAKGSSILKQLNRRLGDEVFFGGVVDHLQRHRFGNATMHDLLESWSRAGAGDLSSFSEGWLRAAGPDTLALDRQAGVVRRTPPADHPAQRNHTIRVAVHQDAGWVDHSLVVDADEVPFDAGDRPALLDPYDDTWAVAVPDPATVEALVTLLPEVDDDLLRAGTWSLLRNAFHNGHLDPAVAVDIAVAALPVEDSEDSGRRTMPWLLGTVVPLAPAGSLSRLHERAVEKARSADPGSGQQLAAFRAAIASASDPDLLRRWLDEVPPGLEPDPDLRWRVLVRLAVLGEIDRRGLDAELAAHPTATSQVEHTRAVASLPDPDAKAWAWARFTGEADVPNLEIEAAGHGMWRWGQEDLTAAYVDRYFADLPATAEVRSGWVLADAADFYFPTTSVSEDTLAKALALADDSRLDRSLRRRLLDRADDLRRRLAVARTFPQA